MTPPPPGSGDTAAIQIQGLTKVYGGTVHAVDDLDLTVGPGEIFGFLGPNGAGKSTTIDVLMDYVRPTAGTATVLGYDSRTEIRAIHQRVGILPDDYGLYDRLTGRTHLEYAIRLKRVDDSVERLIDRVGLDGDDADRPVGDYSTGMTQRLALAIALVGDPDLLILDEPSAGLDPNGVRLVREIVRDHVASDNTVFFSSHILSQVEAVCDRVAILNDGRLVAVDTIDGLRDAVGTGSIVSITVDTVPADLSIQSLGGVTGVTTDGETIRVTVTDPGAKVAVIDGVRDDGATIRDITIRESSLEDLFATYTSATPPAGSTGEAPR